MKITGPQSDRWCFPSKSFFRQLCVLRHGAALVSSRHSRLSSVGQTMTNLAKNVSLILRWRSALIRNNFKCQCGNVFNPFSKLTMWWGELRGRLTTGGCSHHGSIFFFINWKDNACLPKIEKEMLEIIQFQKGDTISLCVHWQNLWTNIASDLTESFDISWHRIDRPSLAHLTESPNE